VCWCCLLDGGSERGRPLESCEGWLLLREGSSYYITTQTCKEREREREHLPTHTHTGHGTDGTMAPFHCPLPTALIASSPALGGKGSPLDKGDHRSAAGLASSPIIMELVCGMTKQGRKGGGADTRPSSFGLSFATNDPTRLAFTRVALQPATCLDNSTRGPAPLYKTL